MSNTTSDDLADGVCAILNAFAGLDEAAADELGVELALVKFAAVVPDEVLEISLETCDGWSVYVVPFGESEETEDRGDACRETLQCDVYVHGPIDNTITRRIAVKFLKQLRGALRETLVGDAPSFRFEATETVSGIYDEDVLKSKQQFLSFFRATYFAFD